MQQIKAGTTYIVVKIDKIAQKTKQEKVGNVFISPKFSYMLYNLQYGEIISIGTRAKKVFPEMEVGDDAIFHHTIEKREDMVVHREIEYSNGERKVLYDLVMVKVSDNPAHNLIYGVMKDNPNAINSKTIVPVKDWVFLEHKTEPIEVKLKSDLIQTPQDISFFQNDENLLKSIDLADNRIGQLKHGLELNKDIGKRVDMKKEIDYLQREKAQLSDYLNKKKFCKAKILYIHPQTTSAMRLDITKQILVRSDLFYPLNILGNSFALIKKTYIYGQFDN
jgi:hypothetical protein